MKKIKGVIYVSDSKNSKIAGKSKVDATYGSIEGTCPSDCALRGESCYAETAYVGIQVARLDKQAKGLNALELARMEARVIDAAYDGGKIPEGRDLRVHVSGDSKTIAGSRLINSAIGRWKVRGGNDVWSYTHSWKNVSRDNWDNVSILASVDKVEDVAWAKAQGYAPAIVVAEFENDKAFTMKGSDVKWIPCPAQTKDDVSCTDCRLCIRSSYLEQSNHGIAFAAHGIRKNNIKRRLSVIQ